jgi:hypothetical protein
MQLRGPVSTGLSPQSDPDSRHTAASPRPNRLAGPETARVDPICSQGLARRGEGAHTQGSLPPPAAHGAWVAISVAGARGSKGSAVAPSLDRSLRAPWPPRRGFLSIFDRRLTRRRSTAAAVRLVDARRRWRSWDSSWEDPTGPPENLPSRRPAAEPRAAAAAAR